MSDIGDLMYRLGYNTVDRFGRKSSEEDRALLREKDKQKAAIEEQNKARIAQMLIDNQAYADRQKAQIAAQQGMAREGQEFDMTRDMLNAAEAANRQQAGFKQQRDMSIDEEIAAGERALMMRDLQKAALREDPRLIAEGKADASKVPGSDAELDLTRNKVTMATLPGQLQAQLIQQGILNDPNNRALVAAKALSIGVSPGEMLVTPKMNLFGAVTEDGPYGRKQISGSITPNLTASEAKQLAAEKAAQEKALVARELQNRMGLKQPGVFDVNPPKKKSNIFGGLLDMSREQGF